ncbi:hypothetical protein PRIPAC_73082 [Pristionchus pacificus]|uniref:Uncharacterized protein n=1 Tax=Pristionchus pacificus TaxID=54126 RepID=A0A2A6C040_PRIPA|nr:hypothetical protein PRIPAC_73082 [Pristionchus pacificus]|eukprot:PDM71391.1 hypothetical protein PRIPAC_37798 [Pristionchus pacificus]
MDRRTKLLFLLTALFFLLPFVHPLLFKYLGVVWALLGFYLSFVFFRFMLHSAARRARDYRDEEMAKHTMKRHKRRRGALVRARTMMARPII